MAWSDNFILPALINSLFTTFGISNPLAFNLLILSAITLNGFFTYKAALTLKASSKGALLAGIAFQKWGYFLEHLGHPQLQFAFFLPLYITYVVKIANAPSFLRGVKVGIIIALTFLSAVYYAAFLPIITLAFIPYFITIWRKSLLQSILYPFWGSILPLIALIPFVIPYLKVKNEMGIREIFEPYYFSTHFFSLFASSSLPSLSHGEARFFPGWLMISALLLLSVKAFPWTLSFWLLAALSNVHGKVILISLYSQKIVSSLFAWTSLSFTPFKNPFLLLSCISAVIALGPLGNPNKGEIPSGPYMAFYYLLPGVDSIRAISRIGIVTYLSLLLYGAKLIKGLPIWLILPFITVYLYENHRPLNLGKAINPSPLFADFLSRNKEVGSTSAFLSLPYEPPLINGNLSTVDFASLNTKAMLLANLSNFKTVNGYSGITSKLMRELPEKLHRNVCGTLQEIIGLKYIFVTGNLPGDPPQSNCLTLLERLDGESIYSVGLERVSSGKLTYVMPSSISKLVIEKVEGEFAFEYQDDHRRVNQGELRKGDLFLPKSSLKVRPRYLHLKGTGVVAIRFP